MGIVDSIMGATDMKLNDQMIAMDYLAGAKGACNAYLNAALMSTTPEIGRLYGDHLTQCIQGNEWVTALCVKRGWIQPYESADNQVAAAFKQSEWVLNPNA